MFILLGIHVFEERNAGQTRVPGLAKRNGDPGFPCGGPGSAAGEDYRRNVILPALKETAIADVAFGRFAVPLGYLAERMDFEVVGTVFKDLRKNRRNEAGDYVIDRLSMVFWMPGGGAVTQSPNNLTKHIHLDPKLCIRTRQPFRPNWPDQPIPGEDTYIVTALSFCPTGPIPPRPPRQQWANIPAAWPDTSLGFYGYGYGAFHMISCWTDRPAEGWIETPSASDPEATLFCRDDHDVCFGWVLLPRYDRKALIYFPKDAIEHVGSMKQRLLGLLRGFEIADVRSD